jgi:signal transduction histidine kinase
LDYRSAVRQVPAFVVERAEGLLDFRAVYDRVLEDLARSPSELVLGLPELSVLLRASGADQLLDQARRTRDLLGAAIVEGDWEPYIEHVRALGASYAELGIAFSHWYSVARVFQHRLMPALVEAYAQTPARLVAALTATTELLDFSIAQVAEQYLEERTRQLEATNREIEAFNYSVAHDLRAPLRSVSGFTQILLEDFAPRLDRDAVSYLTKIQGGVSRMTTLIDALLELAQLSRRELDVRPVNVTAVARTVVGQLAGAEPQREVDVEIQDGLHAMADGRLVRTLLENLIGNAWKFTSKAVAPRIIIGSSDGRTFFVRDNGAGFDIAHARKLFSPFERLHTADDFPGTGVGLATVQRIVDCHGGRIWVQAQVGYGATFFFTLAPTTL